MKLMESVQVYFRNRAVIKYLERNDWVFRKNYWEINGYWGLKHRGVPIRIAGMPHLSAIVYLGNKNRLRAITKEYGGISNSRLEELAKGIGAEVGQGYASDFVFQMRLGETAGQAKEILSRLMDAYVHACWEGREKSISLTVNTGMGDL